MFKTSYSPLKRWNTSPKSLGLRKSFSLKEFSSRAFGPAETDSDASSRNFEGLSDSEDDTPSPKGPEEPKTPESPSVHNHQNQSLESIFAQEDLVAQIFEEPSLFQMVYYLDLSMFLGSNPQNPARSAEKEAYRALVSMTMDRLRRVSRSLKYANTLLTRKEFLDAISANQSIEDCVARKMFNSLATEPKTWESLKTSARNDLEPSKAPQTPFCRKVMDFSMNWATPELEEVCKGWDSPTPKEKVTEAGKESQPVFSSSEKQNELVSSPESPSKKRGFEFSDTLDRLEDQLVQFSPENLENQPHIETTLESTPMKRLTWFERRNLSTPSP